MRPEDIITGLSIIIAILVAVLLFVFRTTQNKREKMKQKFISYLEELDKENERLLTGKIPDKSRRDYKKLLTVK